MAQARQLLLHARDLADLFVGQVMSPLGGDLGGLPHLFLKAHDNAVGRIVGREHDRGRQAEFRNRNLGAADHAFLLQAAYLGRRHFPGLHAHRDLRHDHAHADVGRLSRHELRAFSNPDRQHGVASRVFQNHNGRIGNRIHHQSTNFHFDFHPASPVIFRYTTISPTKLLG